MRPSDQKLFDAFNAAELFDLADRAKQGEFNEFFGKHALPELLLADLLEQKKHDPTLTNPQRVAAHDIRQRLINGEFDAGVEESEEWAESPEGQDAYGRLTRGE